MNNYKVEIFWSKRDDGYVGIAPAFDGLAVVADTRAEALQEVETAIQTYLQIYREDGIPIPAEDDVPEYSGQVRLRLSKSQHQRSAQRAETEGVSLNSYFSEAIAARNGMEDIIERLVEKVMRLMSTPNIQYNVQQQIFMKESATTESKPAGFPGAQWVATSATNTRSKNLEYGEIS